MSATKIVLIISPLRLLVQLQAQKLDLLGRERGFDSIALVALGHARSRRGRPPPEAHVPPLKGGKLAARILGGSYRVLFVTPEKLDASIDLRAAVALLSVQHRLLSEVFDEMHCISEWGTTFRSAYLRAGFWLAAVKKTAQSACAQARALALELAELRVVEAQLAERALCGARPLA